MSSIRTFSPVALFLSSAVAWSAPAVRVELVQARLLGPAGERAVGLAHSLTVVPGAFRTPTRMAVTHRGPVVDVDAEVELLDPDTFVQLSPDQDAVLDDTGGWTVVLRKDASVPLLGGSDAGWELAMHPEELPPVARPVLPSTARARPPAATGKSEPCLVKAMHARAEQGAPRWEPASYAWDVHRGARVEGAWRSAWARSRSLVVHGFVHDDDVVCGVGSGGGFGLSGVGTGSSDGSVVAREGWLPAGTELLAAPGEGHAVGRLKARTRALLLEDGSWHVPAVREGSAWVQWSGVHLRSGVTVPLAPPARHGTGSLHVTREEWPRRAAGR